jgi:hypothetical protein
MCIFECAYDSWRQNVGGFDSSLDYLDLPFHPCVDLAFVVVSTSLCELLFEDVTASLQAIRLHREVVETDDMLLVILFRDQSPLNKGALFDLQKIWPKLHLLDLYAVSAATILQCNHRATCHSWSNNGPTARCFVIKNTFLF